MEAIYREIDEPLNSRKLFLGGLRSQSNEQHLWEAFLPYGHLVEVIFVRDENGKPKGFGFVVFSKAYMMEAVISAHPNMRVIVDGKSVEIKRISEGEPSRSKAAMLRAAVPNENTTRVFVGGIPEITKEQHLRDYFSTFGEVVEAEIPASENTGKPRGFAFVTFASKDIVGACVGKKFHKFLGKMVEVKRAIEKEQLRRDTAPPIPRPDPPKDKGKAGAGGRGGSAGGRGGGGRRGAGVGARGAGGGRGGGGRGGGGWGREGGWGGDGILGGRGGGRGGGRDGGFGRGDMRGMHGGSGQGREFGRDGRPFDQDFGRERPPFDGPMGPRGPRGLMESDVPGMPRDLMGMGSRGPGGRMDRERMMERGPDRGPRGPMGLEIPGESMGMGSKGPGGSRDGRGSESRPPGRGPQSFGAMDKWDDAMFDSMPSEEMMRRQFGEAPMDFPGEFPGDTPSSRPGASVPEVPGDFRRELSEVERDLEMSKNKMKEYYKTMYMWKLKWYQMMKTWTAAKAAAAAEASASVSGAGTSRDSFPAASKSQASSYGNTEGQWGQAPGQQAPGGGNGAGDPYRGPAEDYSQSQANQGNYSNLGSNYGNMQSGYGPMKKEPSYPGPHPGGPYGGGMPGM